MTNQQFSFLLILIMAITPVTAAFSYYPVMASQLSAEPSFAQVIDLADMANDTGDAATQNSDQCHQHNKVKMDCHASSSCLKNPSSKIFVMTPSNSNTATIMTI